MSTSPTHYIVNLARSFPCLEPKIKRWNPVQFDPDEFYSMACRWSSTERHAAHFVLTVWNPGAAKEKSWAFNIVDAASFLDQTNREPILRWIARPFYP